MNLSTEGYRAFTHGVEEELGAFTVQQRGLATIVNGGRGPLEYLLSSAHAPLEKLSLVTYLSLFDTRDPRTGAHLIRSTTVAQLLGIENSLLLHFEKLSRPVSPDGDDVVLYDTEDDLQTFFEVSLEHAGYYLLGIPLRLDTDLSNKLKLHTLTQIIDYFQCTRIIREDVVTPVSGLDDASRFSNPFSNDKVTVVVLNADFGREHLSFFHKALNLKEAGVCSVQIWQRVSRSREVKFVRELWLSPYVPRRGRHFSFSSRLDKEQELLMPTRRFQGMSLNEFLTCPITHLLQVLENLDGGNDLNREMLILKRLHEVGLGDISLWTATASLSHGQRELLVLCNLLLTSFTDFTFRVIGDLHRFGKDQQKLLLNLLVERVGDHNRIEYYSTLERGVAEVRAADLVVEEQVSIRNFDLPFELPAEGVVVPLNAVTVVEGGSLSGKTTLLREQLVSFFKQGILQTLKQRSFTPFYVDLSVVPQFGEKTCGEVVGSTESLAQWFAALPDSRRHGLGKSDFLSSDSPLVDKVKFQGLAFREVLSMTFNESFVFFSESNPLRDEIIFLLEAGFARLTWFSSVSALSLSARKRLQVVKVLLNHKRLLGKRTRKQLQTILLLDELFSGVPTDLQPHFCSMLRRLSRRGITIVMSSASPVADAWIDQRLTLAYNEKTGRSLISQISAKETDRYG